MTKNVNMPLVYAECMIISQIDMINSYVDISLEKI